MFRVTVIVVVVFVSVFGREGGCVFYFVVKSSCITLVQFLSCDRPKSDCPHTCLTSALLSLPCSQSLHLHLSPSLDWFVLMSSRWFSLCSVICSVTLILLRNLCVLFIFHLLEAFLHQKSYIVDMLGCNMALCISP